MKRKKSRLQTLADRGDQLRFNIAETKAILAELEFQLVITQRLYSQELNTIRVVPTKAAIIKTFKTLNSGPSPFFSLIKKHNKEKRK